MQCLTHSLTHARIFQSQSQSRNLFFFYIFSENGLLSYENPNYHMDPQRIESNSHLYEEILSELQQQNTIRTTGKSHIVSNRKAIARLNIGSMGVDLKEHFHRYVFCLLLQLS